MASLAQAQDEDDIPYEDFPHAKTKGYYHSNQFPFQLQDILDELQFKFAVSNHLAIFLLLLLFFPLLYLLLLLPLFHLAFQLFFLYGMLSLPLQYKKVKVSS